MPNSKINKILFDVSLPGEEKDFALKKAKDLFYEKIMKVISQVFDDFDGSMSIPKMELDLGALPENELEDALKSAIIKQLQKAPQSTTIIDHKLVFKNINDTPENRENILTSTDHFLYFLQHGYWPWHIQNETVIVVNNFLLDYLKDDERTNVLLQLLPHQSKNVLDRFLILMFSDMKLKSLFLSALQSYHPLFYRFILLLPSGFERMILIESGFTYQLFYLLLKTSKLQSLEDIKTLVLKTFNIGYNNNGKWMRLFKSHETLLKQGIQAADNESDMKNVMEIVQQKQSDLNTILTASNTLMDEMNDDTKENDESDEMQSHKGFEPMLTEEDGKITIANAGLVLFHLYLPYIFKDLKWINASNKFIDAKKQQKAVHFLQYLIDGKSRHDEHVLVLNKMLCGWPIHLPLTLKCNFSKKEKDIAKEAIESLKEHWAVMKNTSAEGLMESFVKRQGIVQRNQSGYLLQIERKTIDILLDSLPFGIGTIKLPWNEYIISTEW